MSFYDRHVFFCCNQRDAGADRPCCAGFDAIDARAYAKQKLKALGLTGEGKVRINQAGCLDRCEEGPVLVIYPEGVWYTYVDTEDVDEIIERHVIGGEVVQRLTI